MKFADFDPQPVLEMGINAFANNQNLSACPFRSDSLGEDVWCEGWRSVFLSTLNENTIYEDEFYDDVEDFYLRWGWIPDVIEEAVYQGRKVPLRKVMKGDVKRNKVYVNCGNRKDKDGNVIAKKIEFGSEKGSKLRVRKGNAARRKSFAARHNCDTAKDPCTARYWSCRSPQSKHGGVW